MSLLFQISFLRFYGSSFENSWAAYWLLLVNASVRPCVRAPISGCIGLETLCMYSFYTTLSPLEELCPVEKLLMKSCNISKILKLEI